MRSSDSPLRASSGPGAGDRRTLALLLLPLTIVALLAVVYMGLTVSSALRGYVAAFGRWTQEQKTGTAQLNRFAVTRNERDYERYVEAQRVPDGGRVAWVALTQAEPDVGAATEGFIAGGANPEDAADMARMFRWLSPLAYFRHVADLWPEADAGRAQTDQQARSLRDLIRAGARDTARIRAVLDSIDATDARISQIERDFATSIGVGARSMTSAILYATISIGVVLMIVGTFIGIRLYQHERASVEVVHQRAEEFRALVEHAPDIIVRFARDLRITYVNPAVERVAGIPPLTVVGHSADALHIADGRATELEAVVLDVFGSGRDSTIELDLETSRGTRSFQVRLTSERAPDRTIDGVLAIASDITELKASERALREQDDKIRHVQKMEAVGRLASGVAHEFNNLLTVLAGSLDLAREEIGRGGDALREIGTARQAADRAYGLTRQLLLFNRRDVSRLRIVRVTDTVRQLESVFTRVIGEHLTIETSLDAETPDVRMDRGDLEQIVRNLVINAAHRDAGHHGAAHRREPDGKVASAGRRSVAGARSERHGRRPRRRGAGAPVRALLQCTAG